LAQSVVIKTLLVDPSAEFLDGACLWIVGRPELVVVGKARTGLEALEAVARLEPDLVIMDCVLPGLDGFRAARLMKALDRPPLVVIATFVPSKTAREEALAAGADEFIGKDEFAGGLERFLDEVLERRSGARGAATRPETRDRHESRIEPDP